MSDPQKWLGISSSLDESKHLTPKQALKTHLDSSRHGGTIPVLDMLTKMIADGSKGGVNLDTELTFVSYHLSLFQFWNFFQAAKRL